MEDKEDFYGIPHQMVRDIIYPAVIRGLNNRISVQNNVLCIEMNGFYFNDPVRVFAHESNFSDGYVYVIHGRNQKLGTVGNWDELVRLSFKEFSTSPRKETLEPAIFEDMVRLNLIDQEGNIVDN